MTEIVKTMRVYADAVDIDREGPSGLTDVLREGADEIERLRAALVQMRGYVKLWSDDVDAGLKPTNGSLSDAFHLLAMTLERTNDK